MPSGAAGVLADTAQGAAMGSVVPGIGTIIGGTVGLAEGIIGLSNEAKAKKEAEQQALNRPQYQISPLAGQELSLSESDLGNGMSAGATKAYDDLNNQQYSSSIGAIVRSGGDVNSIGSIYGSSQDGRLKLAQMKDNIRLAQINNYVKANNAYQDAQQTQWQLNKFAPWQDKAQAISAARQGASQQASQGLNTATSAAMGFANNLQEQNALKNPVIVNNPNNPNFTPSGLAVPDAQNYNYTNSNFQNTNTVTPMNMPSYGN